MSISPGYRVTREEAILEGVLQTIENYRELRTDIEKLREQVKETPGFALSCYVHYNDKERGSGFSSLSWIGPYEIRQFPTTVRTRIKFQPSAELEEYSEMLLFFKNRANELAEKYKISCSFKNE